MNIPFFISLVTVCCMQWIVCLVLCTSKGWRGGEGVVSSKSSVHGVNLTVQDLLRQDARIQDLYFNISEMKLSITSLFSFQIMSYLGVSDIIYSDVFDSFISEILKYESSVIVSSTEKPWAAPRTIHTHI